MKARSTVLIALLLGGFVATGGAGLAALRWIASRARTTPPAWAGAATVQATLSCPTAAAEIDGDVIARRVEALQIDGEARVIDAQHLSVTLRDVRGPEALHALLVPYRLAMTEVLDGAVTLDVAAIPPGVDTRELPSGGRGFFAGSSVALAPLAAHAPPGTRLVVQCATAPGEAPECEGVFVREPASITNDDVESAEVAVDADGIPYVSLVFTSDGAARFATLTRGWIRRRLAIVVDDTLMSAPMVMGEIAGGRASLTLGAADSLADVLARASTLAAALDVGAPLSCAWRLETVN